jgi:hypothetical protein
VPKGFEELVKYLKREPDLREKFFARVRMLFYAGAALTQHVWDELDSLAMQTIGATIQKMAGFGSTETAPFALICRPDCAHAGVVGLPAPGVEIKLAPVADKMEARIRGPNVTPGYWKMPAQTDAAFDEDGFYKFGDAFRWVDPARRELGFAFDGRITEDFKLATGTWVSVGPMRGRVLAALAPYAHDAVIAGINRDYVAVMIVPDLTHCRALCGGAEEPHDHPALLAAFRERLAVLAGQGTGSASRVARAMILREPPNIDAGEITDKGSLNQRAVLARRAALVDDSHEPRSGGPWRRRDLGGCVAARRHAHAVRRLQRCARVGLADRSRHQGRAGGAGAFRCLHADARYRAVCRRAHGDPRASCAARVRRRNRGADAGGRRHGASRRRCGALRRHIIDESQNGPERIRAVPFPADVMEKFAE